MFIGSHLNGYVGSGMGFGTIYAEGLCIVQFSDAVGMVVYNIFFKKEDSKLITYQSGDNRSMIDYLMVRKIYICLVNDVNMIESEECVPQHQMVIEKENWHWFQTT